MHDFPCCLTDHHACTDSVHSVRGAVTGMLSLNQSKSSVLTNSGTGMPSSLGKSLDDKPKINMNGDNSLEAIVGSSKQSLLPTVNSTNNRWQKQQCDSIGQNLKNGMSSTVFKGKTFCFSISFAEDRHAVFIFLWFLLQRAEIVEWVDQGGGEVVEDQVKRNVNFIIECHGVIPRSIIDSQITYVSTHWVRSCLEDLRTQALGVKNESIIGGRNYGSRDEAKQSIVHLKRARHSEDDDQNGLLVSGVHLYEPLLNENSTEINNTKIVGEAAQVLPDVGVVAAIEDLLEQTSKIHDQKSPDRMGVIKGPMGNYFFIIAGNIDSLFSSPIDLMLFPGLKKDEICSYSGDVKAGGLYDGFSERQTESQVVGYEEDLSGRQMLIDQSSNSKK
ncbi:hypothetical protein CRYUN_Cryun28dG0036000 [Craigia yunnanensis]